MISAEVIGLYPKGLSFDAGDFRRERPKFRAGNFGRSSPLVTSRIASRGRAMGSRKVSVSNVGAMASVLALVAAPALAASGDAAFLKKAVAGDTGEIAMGGMLQQKGAAPAVRDFGKMLVSDHTDSRQKAEGIARTMKVGAPEIAEPDAARTANKLSRLSGPAFDRAARAAAIKDHKKDIAEYEKEARSGSGPAAQHARATLSVLKKHLAAAEALPT